MKLHPYPEGGGDVEAVATVKAGSVVIPAYNEAAVIAECLRGVASESGAGIEVVVVANGCTDDTVSVAESQAGRLPNLTVIDLSEPGKIAALNAGDAAVKTYPRIYLDADIVLEPGALTELIETLRTPLAVVASPTIRFDTSGASWTVRSFYRIFAQMPYVTNGLVGLGVYGVSQAGRERFRAFPEVTADDLFVQEMFAPDERLRSLGHFVVRVPRRWSDLVSVRSRGARGKSELADLGITAHALDRTATNPGRALFAVLRNEPWRALDAVVYVLVTVVARRRARRVEERWARDDSSRVASPTGEDEK